MNRFLQSLGSDTIRRIGAAFSCVYVLAKSLVFPLLTSFERRQLYVIAVQMIGNPGTLILIAKAFHRYYRVKHYFLLVAIAGVFPFVSSFFTLVRSISCPHMAALVSNLALIMFFVLLTALGSVTFGSMDWATPATAAPIVFLFVMMIWPWIAMMSMVSRLHIGGDKKQNQFSPLKHLPALGMLGVMSLLFMMEAAKTLTISNFVAVTFIDAVISVIPSLMLGKSRLNLSLTFMKIYILLIVLFVLYVQGDVSPWAEDALKERLKKNLKNISGI